MMLDTVTELSSPVFVFPGEVVELYGTEGTGESRAQVKLLAPGLSLL